MAWTHRRPRPLPCLLHASLLRRLSSASQCFVAPLVAERARVYRAVYLARAKPHPLALRTRIALVEVEPLIISRLSPTPH